MLKLFGAKIDYSFRPYPTSKIWSPKNLSAGTRSGLGPKSEIYNPGAVRLGKDVNISQDAYICSASRKRRNGEFVLVIGTIEIEDDVWIAAKAFVGPNLKIGAGSIIGACTVLTKDTPKNSRATGNPATITSEIH
ncbi:hypothetical protein N9E68_00060 [Amylibacter sp.]|nr:hypothetical protein [Amylibacter sp.]